MNQARKSHVLDAEHTSTRGLRSTLEASAWLLLAVATIIYGNGRHDLVTVVLHHPDIWRYPALPMLVNTQENLLLSACPKSK